MTTAAFATWNNQIAPVFDVSRIVCIVKTRDGKITRQTEATLADGQPGFDASRLKSLMVDTLVCGAISRPLHAMVTACGIEVIPFVAGDLEEIIQAWLCGALIHSTAYAMPGCQHVEIGRFNGRSDISKGGQKMMGNKTNRLGGNQRRKKQGSRQGRGNGQANAQRNCICPRCGFRAPHQPGIPCMHTQCNLCGTIMNRQ